MLASKGLLSGVVSPPHCFGKNENCRLCGGSGIVSSEAQSKFLQPKTEFTALSFTGKTYDQMQEDAKTRRQQEAAKVVRVDTAVEYWKNRFKKMRAAKK
jgi:hypothetical protein